MKGNLNDTAYNDILDDFVATGKALSCFNMTVPVTGNINSTAYNYILHYSVLSTLWQQFGEGPFLFQRDNDPVHKARSIQKYFVQISFEELDWPVQSPDLSPFEHTFGMNWNVDCNPGLSPNISTRPH